MNGGKQALVLQQFWLSSVSTQCNDTIGDTTWMVKVCHIISYHPTRHTLSSHVIIWNYFFKSRRSVFCFHQPSQLPLLKTAALGLCFRYHLFSEMYEITVKYLEAFPECYDALRSWTNLKLLLSTQTLSSLRIIHLSIAGTTKKEEPEMQN